MEERGKKDAAERILEGLEAELGRTAAREAGTNNPVIAMVAGAQKATLLRMIDMADEIIEGAGNDK